MIQPVSLRKPFRWASVPWMFRMWAAFALSGWVCLNWSLDALAANIHSSNESDNQVRLISISPDLAHELSPGHGVTIEATLRYNLAASRGSITLLAREEGNEDKILAMSTNWISGGSGTIQMTLPELIPTHRNIRIQAYVIPLDVAMAEAQYQVEGVTPFDKQKDMDSPSRQSLRMFMATYLLTVNQSDPEILEALMHPDLLARISPQDRQIIRRIFLNNITKNKIPADHVISYRNLSSDDIDSLPPPWHQGWFILPEAETHIMLPSSQENRTGFHIFTARYNNKWYLVFPVPAANQEVPRYF